MGSIAGSFGVTPNGQASYKIPLPAPGGAGGLAPQLSIVYASGSGPGLLGWETTIGGLSAIKRCAPTRPYDGTSGALTLTESDRFCLDGNELTTSFVYGQDGAHYTTTPSANLLAISMTSNMASGPNWFMVKHQNGSVWEYGHEFDSQVNAVNASGATVHRLWALDKITDASGNVISFHYTQPNGTGAYYLSEVDWGGNASAGTTPDHSYVFTYATVGAAATVYRYLVGNEIVRNRRLSRIRLEYNGATVLDWTPNYLAPGAGSARSRLSSLSECDANGDCLPATSFDWQQGTTGFNAAEDTEQVAGAGGFVADINGDGREDLVYPRTGQWRVRFGLAAGGFGDEHATGIPTSDQWVQPIHYQPGAADQILYVNANNQWAVDAWTAGGFSATSTGIAADGQGVAADVNGDGYDDLVTYNGDFVDVRLNQARTASPGFGSLQTAYTFIDAYGVVGFRGVMGARGPSHRLHFQGGGEGVIVRVEHHTKVQCGARPCIPIRVKTQWHDVALTWGANGTETLEAYASFAASAVSPPGPIKLPTDDGGGKLVPLDVNGDGLTDLVISGTATLLLNSGKGLDRVAYGSGTGGLELGKSVAVDYGGNGLDDLLVPGTNGHWMLLASTGTGFAAPVDTGIASGAFGAHPVVADTEGRMLADLVGVNGAGKIELALRQGSYPDLLTKVSDGLGNYDSLNWAALSDSSIVQATLDQGKIFELTRRGRYLVASVTRNDGIGGSYTESYAYDTPLLRAGVGFSGIRQITMTDGRDGKTLTHDSTFGKFENGLVASTTLAQANGHKVRVDDYQYEDLEKGQPLLFDSPETTHYDQQGDKLYTVTRAYAYDLQGIPFDIKVSTKDVASGDTWVHDTTFSTSEDQNDWCFGVHSTATVTDTLPDGTSQVRKTTFTPDYTHCRESGWTTNSNLATALQTQTTLTYGAFGNVKVVKVVGHKHNGDAMPARTTSYGYDARGEFRTSVTDPLGEETQYGWDAALGVKISETAPNGNITSRKLDGFGRVTKTTFPSGAYQTASRLPCTGNACNHWAFYVLNHIYTANDAAAGSERVYYDSLGRVYVSQRRIGSGAPHPWSETAYHYDALGRLRRKSAPFFSGSGDPVPWTDYSYDALGRIETIEAPMAGGNGTAITTYGYTGLTTKITDPAGNITHKTVNPLGQIVSIKDALGYTTSYQYAPFGKLKQVTGPDGVASAVSYDDAGFRTSLDAPDLGGTLSFQTDSLGEVTRRTDAAGHKTDYSYDTLGRMRAENFIGASSQNATWTYATSGNAVGQLKKATKANGFVRTLAYNAQGQPVTVTETYARTAMTMHYGYDSLGRIASITYPLSVSADGAPTAEAGPDQSVVTGTWATLDGSGSSDPDGDTLSYSWSIVSGGGSPTLNDADRAVAQFQSETAGQWTLKLTVSDGRQSASDTVKVSVTPRPDNAPTADAGPNQNIDVGTSATLDGGGSSDPDGDPLSYHWSIVHGGPASLTDSNQAVAHFESGTTGAWTLRLTVSDGTQSASDTVQVLVFAPAPNPPPVAHAGPDQATVADAWATLNGSGSFDPGGNPLTYQWSIVSGGGRPTLTNVNQAVAQFRSDATGQWIVKLTVSDGSESDSDTIQITVAPHAPGGLTASPVKSQGGNYSLSWSSVAGVKDYQLWETQEGGTGINPPCLVYEGAKTGTSFTHHVNGNYSYFAKACVNGACSAPSTGAKVYVTGSSGTASACLDGGSIGMQPNATSAALIVQYHYDANGNLASVVNANTGTIYWQADANAQVPAVSAWGAPQAWTLGNGIHVQLDQDRATGAVTSIMAGPGENDASRVSLAYGYGPLGNTTSAFDVVTGVGYKLNTLTYNALNMLRQFPVYNDTGYHNRYANYKIGGNISWRTAVGTYAYNGAEPHAVTRTTAGGQVTHYSYNEVGEMISGGGLSQIQWTRAGRAKKLVGDQTTRLAYGASGTLVQKTVAGTVSRYFGKLIVKTGSTWRARIVAGGEVVAIVNVNAAGYPTTDYLVHDAQGSPAALLDASGGLIYRFAFNAWGEMVNPLTGIGPDPEAAAKEAMTTIGYTGHEEFWKAGLVHTRARLYNPRLGRWLSPDPTVPNLYNGQNFNRYSYVLNNPLTFADPLGLDSNPTINLLKVVVGCDLSCQIFKLSIWVAHTAGRGGPRGVGSSGSRGKNSQQQSKKNPCAKQSLPWYKAIYEVPLDWILHHGFLGAGMRGALPIVGPVGPAVGAGGTLSNRGLSGEGSLGVGEGGEANAVMGLHFGNPSGAWTGGTVAYGTGLGAIVTVESGPNGTYVQVGIGFVGGEFAQYSPFLGSNTDGSKNPSVTPDQPAQCPASS